MPVLTVTTADIGDTFLPYRIVVYSIHCHGLGGSVAGNVFELHDPVTDALLYRTYAAGAWYEMESITQRIWINGFKVDTLDAGEIDIEYDIREETRY